MATSPLFGWQEPDDTSLVKDGAAAIRTLGNAIDSSMGDLLGGTTGQVLAKASNTNMDFTWVAQDDSNAIQNAIVDAKGDLIAATANDTPARLAVGNNGETLVADSSATTGLRYQGNFAAGKNAIINGAFNVWQRGTSFSVGASNVYCADRFIAYCAGATATVSQQAFTAGAAPVSGYESQYFTRIANGSGGTYYELQQRIEDVRTFAGQTVTFSFWAKASAATTAGMFLLQNFGSGGSSNVSSSGGAASLTTSWQRFSLTVTLGTMTGKTIGAGSYLSAFLYYASGTVSSVSIDTWGWQVEASNTATAFQTATGTIQGELAACQRYYVRFPNDTGSVYGFFNNAGYFESTTSGLSFFTLPVEMRQAPSTVDFSSNLYVFNMNATNFTPSTITLNAQTGRKQAIIAAAVTGATTGQPAVMRSNNSTSTYIGFSAEL
jgi:hypothetical protein